METTVKNAVIAEAKAVNLVCYKDNGFEVFELTQEYNGDKYRVCLVDCDEHREEMYEAVKCFEYDYDLTDEQVALVEEVLFWATNELLDHHSSVQSSN